MPDTASPGPHDAQFRQGLAWLQDHLLNHAEITFRRILAAEPDHVQALRLHGIALYKLGRRDEGIAALTAAAEREAANPRAWADLAVGLRVGSRGEGATPACACA